jgi:transposase
LVWDRFLPHRTAKVQDFFTQRPPCAAFFLPPYAPELNPVEPVWGYLKMNPMANLAPLELKALATLTRTHARSVQRKQRLLRSFLKRSPLSLRLK